MGFYLFMRVVRFFKVAAILGSFGLRNDLKDGRRRQAGSSCQTSRQANGGRGFCTSKTTAAGYTGKRDAICRYITIRYTPLSTEEEQQRDIILLTQCRRLT